MICMECLRPFEKLLHDKGMFICQSCFGKRYSKKRFINANIKENQPTLKDLKKKWERK